jgi:hypothetical protein
MREKITYRYIAPNTQEFRQMQTFAESFDHQIVDNPNVTLHAFYRGDTCFGYSDCVYLPVTYPAFHPAITRPRDVVQVMSDWVAHTQLAGKAGYIGVPLNNRDGAGNFPEETMNKLGLQRTHRELYIPI